jgi:hypothetical protein
MSLSDVTTFCYYKYNVTLVTRKCSYISCSLQEVEALRQEKLEIDQQLRSIHGSTMGSMQNFPIQRRNDRSVNQLFCYTFYILKYGICTYISFFLQCT